MGRNLAIVEDVAAAQDLAVDSGEAPEGRDRMTLVELQRDLHKVLGEWLEYIVDRPEL